MITNVTYTASSTKTNYPPSDAVIDNDGAWCTGEIPPNQYLDVNLGNLYDVCGVKIQGYADGTVNSYPSKYKLAFSSKENVWSVPTQVNMLHAYLVINLVPRSYHVTVTEMYNRFAVEGLGTRVPCQVIMSIINNGHFLSIASAS